MNPLVTVVEVPAGVSNCWTCKSKLVRLRARYSKVYDVSFSEKSTRDGTVEIASLIHIEHSAYDKPEVLGYCGACGTRRPELDRELSIKDKLVIFEKAVSKPKKVLMLAERPERDDQIPVSVVEQRKTEDELWAGYD